MTDRPSPAEPLDPRDEGLLVDGLLGELAAHEAVELKTRIAADGALRADHERLRRLFDAERARVAPDEAQAAAAAPRVAAQIRQRVAAERRAPVAASPRSRRWVRVLTLSIGAHVAALALLAYWIGRDGGAEESSDAGMAARFVESDDAGLPDEVSATARLMQELAREAPIQVPDAVLLGAAEAPRDEDSFEFEQSGWDALNRADAPRRPLEHPREVAVSMWIRREPALKTRRLSLLGFEADGTLRAVRKGLRWLGLQQRANGSFAAPAGTSELEQTAVALLPFLGDGFDSTRAAEGPDAREIAVVRDGIAWLRSHVFQDGAVVAASPRTLGAVTMALAEDYMLGYGRLRLSQARQRAREITRLTEVLRARPAAPRAIADAPWALWGIDAALRTGLVPSEPGEPARFRAWVASASARATLDVSQALPVGTAVLLQDPSPDKSGFRAWSGTHAHSLVESLLPNGRLRSDSDDVGAVGETARMLLALQIAYRTY